MVREVKGCRAKEMEIRLTVGFTQNGIGASNEGRPLYPQATMSGQPLFEYNTVNRALFPAKNLVRLEALDSFTLRLYLYRCGSGTDVLNRKMFPC